MLNEIMHNIFVASFITTCMILIFISLKKIIIKYIGAQWHYYLWFIIFVPWFAVWLPFNISSNTVSYIKNLISQPNIAQYLQITSSITNDSHTKMLFMIWLTGALSYSLFILIIHFKFILLLKKNSFPTTFTQSTHIPLDRIYFSPSVTTPFICHIIKSKIYLPINFHHDFTLDEQTYILQHESVHYYRCDLIANTAMLFLICLNWFNPIMHFSYRHFRGAQELSCDAILSQQFSSTEKKAYGYALLKASFDKISPSIGCSWNNGKQLKERFEMLKLHHKNPIKNLVGLIALLVTTTIAIAAPNLEKFHSYIKISNSSKNPITFKIHNSCFSAAEAHSVKSISQDIFFAACNQTQCKYQVFTTADCSGKTIGNIVIDKHIGIISISPPFSTDYHIGANGFNFFFDGPWV